MDEDLIADVRSDGRPRSTIYLHPGTVAVIGKGGNAWMETRPDRLAEDGVPLLRRRGGGCAVVLDPGNLVCSAALPLEGVGRITEAFTALSAAMIDVLGGIGLTGVVREDVSDLAYRGRKLGGSCIWRTRGLLYYSTTVLVNPAWNLIERYLPYPPREPEYRRGRSHREFLTSLTAAGISTSPNDLVALMQADLASRIDGLAARLTELK